VIAALLVCGCSKSSDLDAQARKPFDVLRRSVRKEMSDSSRVVAMLARVDTLEQRSLELIRATRAERDSLIRMYADRSVEDAALLNRFRDDERQRAERRRSLLDARVRLKSIASPAEWAAMSNAETKAMNQVAALTRGK